MKDSTAKLGELFMAAIFTGMIALIYITPFIKKQEILPIASRYQKHSKPDITTQIKLRGYDFPTYKYPKPLQKDKKLEHVEIYLPKSEKESNNSWMPLTRNTPLERKLINKLQKDYEKNF